MRDVHAIVYALSLRLRRSQHVDSARLILRLCEHTLATAKDAAEEMERAWAAVGKDKELKLTCNKPCVDHRGETLLLCTAVVPRKKKRNERSRPDRGAELTTL